MVGRLRNHWRMWSVGAVTVPVAAVLVVGQTVFAATPSVARATVHSVRPHKTGELDCNGYSPIQKPAASRKLACTDIRGISGHYHRFYDNGHYIGHDEPSIRFLSSQPGSGNNVTFTETLPRDPAAPPGNNNPGHDVTHWFELSVAPWFGMTICDPNSYPQTKCTPKSDNNAPHGTFPGGGAAFMEMQFYPPGFAPFSDSISCNNTHWCSALTIDSLEATDHSGPNPNCEEPVNFAFIQRNGVPAGPPSPQLSNGATFTPNSQTLMMNPGDVIRTHMWDASLGGGKHAFKVQINDLTTGQSGFMQASAANGFMNTNYVTCAGTPFNFQPLFNTARAANSDGWSVLLSGILTQYETGHFIPCKRVTGPFPVGSDTSWTECHGAYEKAGLPDGTKKSQEVADALCYKKGDTHGGTVPPNLVTGCEDNFTQNGDLDFDGTPYYADWPTSTVPNQWPSTFLQQQPTTVGGARYPKIQFETDLPASEVATCGPNTPAGCTVPPKGPGHFYPSFTLAKVAGVCAWEFGNMHNGNRFGGDRQYAHLVPHGFFKGQFDFASAPLTNPHC